MAIYETRFPFSDEINIRLAFYDDVTNFVELKKDLLDGKINATFLKSSMIVDPFQVLAAATRAIHLQQHGKMITRTLYSEVIFCLSCSKNISDSFKRFGFGEDDTSLVVVEICGDDKSNDIHKRIHGTLKDVNDLKHKADTELIKKTYKIKEAELEVGSLLDAIVGRIASKDFITY